MDALIASAAPAGEQASFWRGPIAWLRQKGMGRGYWVFFTAAFFFDAGFSIYFFLFNLFLLDCGFNERAMGWIGGSLTLGSLIGTLPAGWLARRIGVRPLLAALFIAAPVLNSLRAFWIWEPAQIALAFLAGIAMSAWGVCFLPAVARLTTEKNRTAGFSLIFSVSVGTGILGGIICGYLQHWLGMAGIAMQAADVKRLILLASCAIALVGIVPVLRLRMPVEQSEENGEPEQQRWWCEWKMNPFLLRFLPCMALWSAILAAFSPFANVYLTHDLHIPMTSIGLIFSVVQAIQLCMGLVTPFLFRILGLLNGIAATQIVAAAVLACLASATTGSGAIVLYLVFSAAQWMCSPGLYNLLMNETPDAGRSQAAAMTMFSNALCSSLATALAGVLFTRFGYPPVLLGLGAVAVAVAILFRSLMMRQRLRESEVL